MYAIPHRDCGSFAAGGFGSADAYRGWIDASHPGWCRTGGDHPRTRCARNGDGLTADQRQERFELIRYAVDTLTPNPATAVYIDAGHSRWVSAEDMAAMLNEVGVDKARGFSLNTANFYTTEEQTGYGEAISGLTSEAHYVIDTSRNGLGPEPTTPSTGVTPTAEHWAPRPPPTQPARTPTPICGSSVRGIQRLMRPTGNRAPGVHQPIRHQLALNAGP